MWRCVAVAGAILALAGGCMGDTGEGETGDRPVPRRTLAEAADCAPTPGGGNEAPDEAPAGTPSTTRLGPGGAVPGTAETIALSRAGEPLIVTGVVYGPDCRTPLGGATIEAWQTDSRGHYGPGEDCCYLRGVVRTGGDGRYTLQTVVPGRYDEGNPPPRHIHLKVGHPDARPVMTEILFAGDPGIGTANPLAVTPSTGQDGQRAEFRIVLGAR